MGIKRHETPHEITGSEVSPLSWTCDGVNGAAARDGYVIVCCIASTKEGNGAFLSTLMREPDMKPVDDPIKVYQYRPCEKCSDAGDRIIRIFADAIHPDRDFEESELAIPEGEALN